MIYAFPLCFSSLAYERSSNKIDIHHHVGLEMPSITSARFGDRLSRVIITFDGIIQPTNESTVKISDLFPYNHTQFGNKASYKTSSKELIVHMLGDPTISLGDLIVDTTHLKSRADHTIRTGSAVVTKALQMPTNEVKPNIQIAGSNILGKC